ncbi:hypothetical protein IGI04_019079 [Brassica rapa subsp. trilocularis]|uniref:Uncharacterized protein n=1 Tax=Brassica rapa subsp. trilocularis TaxID=1813537 RepID=A0ABQ7MFR8_BRACM|nr:hypothetical protein IGI04_019079 [Brassica rapa subsp. trilocularis]
MLEGAVAQAKTSNSPPSSSPPLFSLLSSSADRISGATVGIMCHTGHRSRSKVIKAVTIQHRSSFSPTRNS